MVVSAPWLAVGLKERRGASAAIVEGVHHMFRREGRQRLRSTTRALVVGDVAWSLWAYARRSPEA
eukprot:scaffold230407_cov30-Tisochrysis_lutea.AAC.1